MFSRFSNGILALDFIYYGINAVIVQTNISISWKWISSDKSSEQTLIQ